MRRVVVAILFTMALVKVGAQNKGQNFFKMPANAKYSRGRVLVKVKSEFKDEVANLSINRAARVKDVSLKSLIPAVSPQLDKSRVMKKGARLQNPTIDISKYYSLTFDASENVEDYINKLYQTGYFEIVEPDYKYSIDFTPNDPSISQQYYLSLIKAIDAWDITQGDTTIVIAIVDTGGNLTHEDLKPNLYLNKAEYPPNGVDDDGNGFIDDYRGWDFIGADTLNLNPEFYW
jgi:serine protease